MNLWYIAAAFLLVALGLLHTLLGESLVIRPLLAHPQLPKLLGSRGFMGRVLRFTWHVTTVALLGIAALLVYWALTGAGTLAGALIVVLVLLASGLISAVVARLKHFSWWVFWLAAGLVWWGAP